MATFQFSLQKVLNLKEKNKEQEEYRYMESFKRYQVEKEQLQQLLNQKQLMEEEFVQGQVNGVLIADIHHTQEYILYLNHSIHQQEKKLEQLFNDLKIKQNSLMEIKKEVKIWDNLRERKREDFNLEENRNEQKELDDMASLRSFR